MNVAEMLYVQVEYGAFEEDRHKLVSPARSGQ
jgi:hypothetical protein